MRLNDRKAIEGMGLDLREVMDLAISIMSAMTFSWGFVHCDPHPGNILVRKHPTKKGKPQIVSTPSGCGSLTKGDLNRPWPLHLTSQKVS
jgi:aarF domain-containing kinase